MLRTILILTIIANIYSAIIEVPDDYPTIQEAINVAEDNDVISISPGIYYESISVLFLKIKKTNL